MKLRRTPPIILLLLCCAPLLLGWHPLRREVSEVQQGNEALAAGDAEAALQSYDEAARKVPDRPELQYDRGLALRAAKRLDEAAEALEKAVHTPDAELRYKAHFALGTVRYEQEDWAGAVEAFKTALKLHPQDDAVRLNFELAWLKLHPPCRLREDGLEENDAPEAAKLLTEPLQEPLRACPGDDDWFALDVPAGAALFTTVKVLGEEAPLTLTLVGPGGEPLQQARGDKELATELRLAPQDGRYRVRVALEPGSEAEPAYELGVEVVPPCPAGNDALERNDSPAEARELTKGEQKGLRICPGDVDWFAVPLQQGEKLAAAVAFPAPRGPLRVDLLAEDGKTVLSRGEPGAGQAVAALDGPASEATRVLVRVAGQLQGTDNRYDLSLTDEPPGKDGQQEQGQQDEQKDQDDQSKKDQEQDKKDQEQDKKDQQQEKEDQQEQQAQPQPVPLDRQAMEQALDALQREDRNVQLEKLLQGLPEQRVEKDW